MSAPVLEMMDRLDLAGSDRIEIGVENGQFISGEDEGSQEFVAALNKLKLINEGYVQKDPAHLRGTILRYFHLCDFGQVHDDSSLEFIQVLSLWIASDKIDHVIKNEMSIELIDYIAEYYIETLEVLRNFKPQDNQKGLLLLNCSFISPLLITISFSYKLNYSNSKRLVNILTLVVVYHFTSHSLLFDELVKLFMVNDSTNMDMFEVFSKLWSKTLGSSLDHEKLDERFLPGPISLFNRFELLKDMNLSRELIDQVIPYDSSEFLLKLSKDIVGLYSQLKYLKSESVDKDSIYTVLSSIISYLAVDFGAELILALITNLKLEKILVNLQTVENMEFRPIINYILFKLSHVTRFDSGISESTKGILTSDILEALEASDLARCKIFFEVIDHNLKTDYKNDFQLLFALQSSLFYEWKYFNLGEHVDSLVESGSSLSVEAIQNNIGFILQNALIKQINPRRNLPSSFKKIINFKRFPPLPRSDFLAFDIHNAPSKNQLNLKNLRRLLDSLLLNTRLMDEIIKGQIENLSQLDLLQTLDSKDLDSRFKATDLSLDQTFVALFTNFIIIEEMSLKSQNFGHDNVSPVFFDQASISNVLKLQTFKIFENLFKLYDTFGIYKFLKFIIEVSYQDLNLQKTSMLLLNHLFFHADNNISLQTMAKSNGLVSSLLKEFINTWNEPESSLYQDFNIFLKTDDLLLSKVKGSVKLDKLTILRDLGFTQVEQLSSQTQVSKLLNVVSPVSSSSAASMTFRTTSSYNQTTNETNGYLSANPTVATKQPMSSNGLQYGQFNNHAKNYSDLSASTYRYNNYRNGNVNQGQNQLFNNSKNHNQMNNYSNSNNNNNNNQFNYNTNNMNMNQQDNYSSRQSNARASASNYVQKKQFLNKNSSENANHSNNNHSNSRNNESTIPNQNAANMGNIYNQNGNHDSNLNLSSTNGTFSSLNQPLATPQAITPVASIYNLEQYYTS